MTVPPPPDAVRRGRLKLALLAVAFALPMAAAWLAYRLQWAPGDAGNYGELIEPRPLPEARLAALDGSVLALAGLRGRWVLVQFDAGGCDAWCERKLFFMRQVRRALGKEMPRVERLWVLTDTAAPRAELLAAIEGTRVARAPDAKLPAAFPAQRSVTDHIYLVDPLGNLMLRFPRDPDASKMIKDLQRLLKYSRIG